ncbi:phasin family protein [Larsenimonas salina]|uniref:phasin family protein n=1 Tax=Larsenimonas salina TaxID=1295565 RepID=UPI0020742BA6|nr:phasin family protein [Larsenimonas salina]MCM5703166.1 phasin family protein [Larsenimonas salina]
MYTMNNPEKMKDVYREQVNTLMGFTQQWMKGVEQLTELNLKTAQDMMSQGADMTQKMLSAREAQEVFNLQSVMFQPFSERSMAYTQNAYKIMSGMQSDVMRLAEKKAAERSQAFQSYVDDLARNAPVGAESTVSMTKSATSATASFYDTVQKMVRQAMENAERNFEAATSVAHEQAKQATDASSRFAGDVQGATKDASQRTATAAKNAADQAQKAAEASRNSATAASSANANASSNTNTSNKK